MSLQDEVLAVFREERRKLHREARLSSPEVRKRVIAKRKAQAKRVLGFYWISTPPLHEVRAVIHELQETHPNLVRKKLESSYDPHWLGDLFASY